jgi:hypothetical protein
MVYESLIKYHFLDIVHRLKLKKNTTFQKSAVLPSSGNETSSLVDPLDLAILSHWYHNNTQRIKIIA